MVIPWQEQLEVMQLVASRFPPVPGLPIVMWRRGKRGRGRLRQAMIVSMRVAAADAVREGEQTLIERDGRRRLAPNQVYDMRVRVLRFERDDALAAEYGVCQSSATRAIDGDTYRDVPFPIRVTHPDVPVEIYYPYLSAIRILAAAPIDQQFRVTIQPHTPRLRIAAIVRLADQLSPAPSSPHPPPRRRSPPQPPSADPTVPTGSIGATSARPDPPRTADETTRDAWKRRRRRFG